jgi:hypothetical protein
VARRALLEHGLLLLHDQRLASVSLLVAGEPVAGSWWSHSCGQAIFLAAEALDDDEDVISAKLVAGKVTFVHRELWPALVGVATSNEAWQGPLSPAARALLANVAREDVRSDTLSGAAKKEVNQLERRLLVHSRQIHTASGRHAKILQAWSRFAASADVAPLPLDAARVALERAAAGLVPPGDTRGAKLPWS